MGVLHQGGAPTIVTHFGTGGPGAGISRVASFAAAAISLLGLVSDEVTAAPTLFLIDGLRSHYIDFDTYTNSSSRPH